MKRTGAVGMKRKDLKTRAVLFLEQTPMGELAKRVREQLVRMEDILGYRIKVVERTGRSLVSCLSQAKVGQGMVCGREACVTCNQGGEDLPDCTRASVVYESVCTQCNPSAGSKEELSYDGVTTPSLYVGESSRSIQERAVEHWSAARKQDGTSHMFKHQSLVHGGEEPEFMFRVVSYHRTALSRQIKEAVRIRRRGGASSILNSKAEFNRCYIPRLVVEQEDEGTNNWMRGKA